jgi:DNA-binding IclR family transcriptional regulator
LVTKSARATPRITTADDPDNPGDEGAGTALDRSLVDIGGEPSRDRTDSSTNRVLGVLDLFTLEEPVWTADRLVEHLGLARATAYRYVKVLYEAGFLAPAAGGGYVLGPRFVEFDRQIRLADPLLQVAPSIIAELRDKVAGAQVLSSFYGDRVLSMLSDVTDPKMPLQMERGRPFPLFFGAPSRIIVAYLPTYQLRNLLLNHGKEIADAGLGDNWQEFRTRLKAIRRAGHYVSSQLNKDVVGVAAPIFRAPNAVTASICLVRRKSVVKPEDVPMMAEWAMDAGARISERLQAFQRGANSGASTSFPTPRLGR